MWKGKGQEELSTRQRKDDRRQRADCGFEIDEVSVFRFQVLWLFFLTPDT